MANAPAAEAEVEAGAEAEAKPKKSIVKIILGVVGLIVLLVGTVFGTLFFSGYFNPKPPVDPDALEEAHGAGAGHEGEPSETAGHVELDVLEAQGVPGQVIDLGGRGHGFLPFSASRI